jgi:ethanolamine transporter EutH
MVVGKIAGGIIGVIIAMLLVVRTPKKPAEVEEKVAA